MAQMRKFLFDTEFPTVRDSDTTHRLDEKRLFTDAEIEAVRAEAYASGHDAGRAAAEQETARLEAQALERFSREFAMLKAGHESALHLFGRDAIQLSLAIGKTLAPKLIERAPLGEIEELVGSCLSQIMGEARVVVHVHETLLDNLKERLGALTRRLGFEGHVILLPDETTAPGDCRVEWADGGAERDTAALGAEIEAAMDRMLAVDTSADDAAPTTDDGAPPTTGETTSVS